MIKQIHVYGDSYAAPSDLPDSPDWPSILSSNLNIPVINNAISGSSTEYSMRRLISDIESNNICENDAIIFVESTPGRIHLQYQNSQPRTATCYNSIFDSREPFYRWIQQNRNFIKWYVTNFDYDLFLINFEAYVHLIRNFAETRPDVTILFLTNSGHSLNIPWASTPPNFLRPNIWLYSISTNESIHNLDYHNFVKYTMYDVRENHLSVPNLKILSDLVGQALITKQIHEFTYDKFVTKIFDQIKTKEQYMEYVEKGYIYYIEHRKDRIQP